jgi:hypothetical protein
MSEDIKPEAPAEKAAPVVDPRQHEMNVVAAELMKDVPKEQRQAVNGPLRKLIGSIAKDDAAKNEVAAPVASYKPAAAAVLKDALASPDPKATLGAAIAELTPAPVAVAVEGKEGSYKTAAEVDPRQQEMNVAAASIVKTLEKSDRTVMNGPIRKLIGELNKQDVATNETPTPVDTLKVETEAKVKEALAAPNPKEAIAASIEGVKAATKEAIAAKAPVEVAAPETEGPDR